MRIAQGGLEVGLVLDYGGGDTEQYSGVANPDAKKPFDKGELAIVFCGTNDRVGDPPTFDEIGRITVKAKQGQVKASFKGTSIFSDPGTGLDTEAGTCKWSYKRTSNDPPMLPTSCLAVATTSEAVAAEAGVAAATTPLLEDSASAAASRSRDIMVVLGIGSAPPRSRCVERRRPRRPAAGPCRGAPAPGGRYQPPRAQWLFP